MSFQGIRQTRNISHSSAYCPYVVAAQEGKFIKQAVTGRAEIGSFTDKFIPFPTTT